MEFFLIFHVDYNIFIKIKMLKKKLIFQTPCKIVEKTHSNFSNTKFYFILFVSLDKQKTNNVWWSWGKKENI
jgi:hypothetical protein